jgi:hypothetical protein
MFLTQVIRVTILKLSLFLLSYQFLSKNLLHCEFRLNILEITKAEFSGFSKPYCRANEVVQMLSWSVMKGPQGI